MYALLGVPLCKEGLSMSLSWFMSAGDKAVCILMFCGSSGRPQGVVQYANPFCMLSCGVSM